ncbi:MAG: nitroreductase family protein, partial [Candidatus Binatia bacterium]
NGTCRFYKPDPLPDEVLARVLGAGRYAPNGGNRQPVRFIAVRDAAMKKQLKDLYLVRWNAYVAQMSKGKVHVGGVPKLVENANHFANHLDEIPALVVVCAELANIYPTDHLLGRLSVVGGGSIYPAVQNFMLACRAEGLGTALTTLLCFDEPEVKRLLAIPDGIVTAALVTVGWPARPFPKRLKRRPLVESVFADRYGEPLPGAQNQD